MQRKYLNFTTYLLILTLCFATLTVMYAPNVAAKKQKHQNDFLLKVTPTDRSINVGEQAKFTVTVESISNSKSWKHLGKVHLTLRGVPWDALGVFSQSTGIPTFESKLKILTTQDVEPGLHEITIIALSKKGRESAKIALLINGESTEKTTTTTTTTQTTSTTTQDEPPSETDKLEVSFSTDQLSYNSGEAVAILGVVKDSSQNSVQDASISIQVDDPLGSAAHIYETTTDSDGSFNDTFTLDSNALHGTYTVFVTAAYQGDKSQADY